MSAVEHEKLSDVRRILAENVRKQRRQLGMSQFQLAERCGISSSFIGEIETSKKYPSAETLAVLAHALGLAPYQLYLDGSDWEVHDRYDSLRRMYHDIKRKFNEQIDESFWDSMR
ncbi:MAG: XRE family transcriptional regulator [Spirochaetaceae bacterium]|nr:MAG: XRE family transcriptional regulator [Spirochaetaceae bacterium]